MLGGLLTVRQRPDCSGTHIELLQVDQVADAYRGVRLMQNYCPKPSESNWTIRNNYRSGVGVGEPPSGSQASRPFGLKPFCKMITIHSYHFLHGTILDRGQLQLLVRALLQREARLHRCHLSYQALDWLSLKRLHYRIAGLKTSNLNIIGCADMESQGR